MSNHYCHLMAAKAVNQRNESNIADNKKLGKSKQESVTEQAKDKNKNTTK